MACQYAPEVWLQRGIERGGSCNCQGAERSGSPMPQLDLLSFALNYDSPDVVPRQPKEQSTVPFKCQKCDFTTTERNKFRRHNERVKHTRFSECSQCGAKLSCPRVLRNHRKEVHGLETGKLCPHGCGFFKNLRSHLHCEHQGTPFKCEKCGASFKRKGNLDRHLSENTCRLDN